MFQCTSHDVHFEDEIASLQNSKYQKDLFTNMTVLCTHVTIVFSCLSLSLSHTLSLSLSFSLSLMSLSLSLFLPLSPPLYFSLFFFSLPLPLYLLLHNFVC